MSEDESSDSSRPPRSRYPAGLRLRLKKEISAVFESGERAPGRLVVVSVLKGTPDTRVVIVASRRVGGAVERNRAKRLLREAYRLNRHRLAAPCHIALVARSRCPRSTRREVEADLLSLLGQLGCLAAPGGAGPGGARPDTAGPDAARQRATGTGGAGPGGAGPGGPTMDDAGSGPSQAGVPE